ncbi:MAG: starch-binding protein, partial [Prevotella sp.]|nr:starch-binding protein [Prevotella sp.]
LVYTTDGTEPSASNGTKVASGSDVEISSNCTLKVALVVGGTVKNVATRKYTVTPFVAHKATVYFKNPDWTSVYFYAWDSSNTLLGSWPGIKMTDKVVIDGVEWYYKAFDVNKKGYTFNIIFNKGMGQQQTVDIGPISQDVYYELSGSNDDKLTVKEVTPSGATSVTQPVVNDGFEIASANGRLVIKSNTSKVVPVYTAQGVLVKKLKVERGLNDFGDMQPGLYIISNQKVVVSY